MSAGIGIQIERLDDETCVRTWLLDGTPVRVDRLRFRRPGLLDRILRRR